jgi:hypothetical protein
MILSASVRRSYYPPVLQVFQEFEPIEVRVRLFGVLGVRAFLVRVLRVLGVRAFLVRVLSVLGVRTFLVRVLLFSVLGVRASLVRVLSVPILGPLLPHVSWTDLYGSCLFGILMRGLCYPRVSWTDLHGSCLFGIHGRSAFFILVAGRSFVLHTPPTHLRMSVHLFLIVPLAG